MIKQRPYDLQFQVDAARISLRDFQTFEDGIERALSLIKITLPKLRGVIDKGEQTRENFHKEWDLLVREVDLDIRDRLLLIIAYFSQYLPSKKEPASQYVPPPLIERLKVSQIPVNFKVMLNKLSPQLRINETQLMMEPLLIDKRKGDLLMTFQEVQNEALAKIRKSFRAQVSKVIMNSNYLGQFGASLKDSKSSYQEGSYVKPIYFLGKGAGNAVVGFLSSALTMGWQINASGTPISLNYYSAINSFYSIIKPPQDIDIPRTREQNVNISDWSLQKFNTLIFQEEMLKVRVNALFPMTAHTISILEAIEKEIITQQKVHLLLTDTCLYLLEQKGGGQKHDLKRLPQIVKISDLTSVSVKRLQRSESKVVILESHGEIKVIVELKENLETMDLILDFLTI